MAWAIGGDTKGEAMVMGEPELPPVEITSGTNKLSTTIWLMASSK